MKGPIKSESERLGRRTEWLERGSWLAGGLVVMGLLMEYGPDIRLSFIKHEWLKAETAGGVLVTSGVFGEVVLGIFIAKIAKRIQHMADVAVAEANERAAHAEQAAAQANALTERERLERIKLERELSPRWFENQHEAIERLKPFRGTEAILRYPPDIECGRTAEQIAWVLDGAGWKIEPQPTLHLNPICEEGITVEAFHASLGPPSPGTMLIDVLNDAEFDAKWPPGVGNRDTAMPVVIWIGIKPRGLSSRLNKHSAVMDKEIRKTLEQLVESRVPATDRIQAAMERFRAAAQEETKKMGPGQHGNRLLLPRWPVTPPQA